MTEHDAKRIVRVAVSACLMGDSVRFDGGHKRDRFVMDVLSPFLDLVPICPEVEMGLGVPRDTLHLAEGLDGPRLIESATGLDMTANMTRWASIAIRRLADLDVRGCILKTKSPSCGLRGIDVRDARGGIASRGPGLFADALRRAWPQLPLIDEVDLGDASRRRGFIESVFDAAGSAEPSSSALRAAKGALLRAARAYDGAAGHGGER